MELLLQFLLTQNAVQSTVARLQISNLMMEEQSLTRVAGCFIVDYELLLDVILLNCILFGHPLRVPNIVALSKGIQVFGQGLVQHWTLPVKTDHSKQPYQVIFCHHLAVASKETINLPQVLQHAFLFIIKLGKCLFYKVNLSLVHIKTDLAELLNLFYLVIKVPCNDVLQINGESETSLIIFPFQCFLIQFQVLFGQKLLRESLQGDYSHPILIEVAEDEIQLSFCGVDPVFQHELGEVIRDQIAFLELVESLKDGLHLEVGVLCYFLSDFFCHQFEAVPSEEVFGEASTNGSHLRIKIIRITLNFISKSFFYYKEVTPHLLIRNSLINM